MCKQTLHKWATNSATLLLLSLGVVACSSGGDNAKNNLTEVGTSTNPGKIEVKVNNTNSDNNSGYTSTIVASDEIIQKTKEEAAQAERAEAERLAAEAAQAKADAIAKGLLSKPFTQGSASYAYLNEPVQNNLLIETLKNNSSTCKADGKASCFSSAKKGDI
ncbi:hypothetical protein ACWIYZ_07320, partial [Ursidibacter arcticus]